MAQKTNRGGKREGAGRKKGTQKLESIQEQYQEEVKPLTRGILLVALGDSMYGKMAANVAISIRYNDAKLPIHLVYSESSISHLPDAHKALFTSLSVCPDEYMTKNGKRNYFKVKTYLYDLSPFDETIVLDVDLILFGGKDLNAIFDRVKTVPISFQSRGFYDCNNKKLTGNYTHWFNVEDAITAYGLSGKIYQLSSEFIYFRKCDEAKAVFDLAKEIFENPKIKSSVEFAGDLPDEFAFNIAMAKQGLSPIKDLDILLWWSLMDKNIIWTDVIKNYIGISIGGINITSKDLTIYHSIIKHQLKSLSIPYHFQISPKKRWATNRTSI